MVSRRGLALLILIGAVCATLLAIATNLISAEIQSWLHLQPWYSIQRLWLLIVLLVVIGAGLALWQYRRPNDMAQDRKKLFWDACAQFRSAFSNALAQLNNGKDIQYVISKSQVGHDAAIDEFRRHLPHDKLKGFDEACDMYRKQRKADPAILQFFRAQATGEIEDTIQKDKSHRASLIQAINKLLAFADPPK
jgi:hypothetical protein